MDKECHGTDVKQRLQRATDVNGEQEHQVHHEQKYWQAEEAVKYDLIDRGGEAAWLCGQGVADGIADGGNALVTCISNMQRRIVHCFTQASQRGIQILCRITRVGATVDIAFQHLQTEPATLLLRHLFGHRVSQRLGFTQQRLGIMYQLDGVVFFVAIDSQLQCFNPATTG